MFGIIFRFSGLMLSRPGAFSFFVLRWFDLFLKKWLVRCVLLLVAGDLARLISSSVTSSDRRWSINCIFTAIANISALSLFICSVRWSNWMIYSFSRLPVELHWTSLYTDSIVCFWNLLALVCWRNLDFHYTIALRLFILLDWMLLAFESHNRVKCTVALELVNGAILCMPLYRCVTIVCPLNILIFSVVLKLNLG